MKAGIFRFVTIWMNLVLQITRSPSWWRSMLWISLKNFRSLCSRCQIYRSLSWRTRTSKKEGPDPSPLRSPFEGGGSGGGGGNEKREGWRGASRRGLCEEREGLLTLDEGGLREGLLVSREGGLREGGLLKGGFKGGFKGASKGLREGGLLKGASRRGGGLLVSREGGASKPPFSKPLRSPFEAPLEAPLEKPPFSKPPFARNEKPPFSKPPFVRNEKPPFSKPPFARNEKPPFSKPPFVRNEKPPFSKPPFARNEKPPFPKPLWRSPPSRRPFQKPPSRSPPSRNPLCEKREASLFEAPSRSHVPPFFVLVLGLPPPPPPLRSPQPHIQKLAPLKTHPRTPHFLSPRGGGRRVEGSKPSKGASRASQAFEGASKGFEALEGGFKGFKALKGAWRGLEGGLKGAWKGASRASKGANLSRLYYPLLKIRPRTPHFPSSFPPERFLRPHPKGLRLCFKFFLPWHCPLSGGLGQVFVYVAGARFARPNHIYKNLPRLYYPLLKIHPRTPHFPSSFPPERFLRPHPKGLRLCFKFFLPWHGPLSRGLGQVFVYVATNSTN